jgi:hypothetical protein
MIKIEKSLVEAILKFKGGKDPYFLTVTDTLDGVHSIVAGDAVSFLQLVLRDDPINSNMMVVPMASTDVPVVRILIKSTTSGIINIESTPKYDLVFSTDDISREFTLHADTTTSAPSIQGLSNVLKQALASRPSEYVEYHPKEVYKFYQALKGIAPKGDYPRILPNGTGPGLVLLDNEPRLFGIIMPMKPRFFPERDYIRKLLSEVDNG